MVHRKRPRQPPTPTNATVGRRNLARVVLFFAAVVVVTIFCSVTSVVGFVVQRGLHREILNPSHVLLPSSSFSSSWSPSSRVTTTEEQRQRGLFAFRHGNNGDEGKMSLTKFVATLCTTAALSATFFLHTSLPALAENELSAKYGGRGFDSSLVDQNCLIDHCSLQAKACLADDPSCRKGLTCTAKCLGDNACITGCMAQYGNSNLDNLLKCTIEDHECIKVAILEGGADELGKEPKAPAPTVPNFQMASMEGTWYKVMGFNPNYDCYACQRNVFTVPEGTQTVADATGAPQQFVGFQRHSTAAASSKASPANNKLEVDVKFSMPRLLPDGSPPPPSGKRETIQADKSTGLFYGSQSVGYNDYSTHEVMVFDTPQVAPPMKATPQPQAPPLVLMANAETGDEKVPVSYSRTAHSQGEMFGLKFWENWYVIGENDPGQEEFKFVYYNGKTRQNTYEGAFVYGRSPKDMSPATLKKVYAIASSAGMNPDQFCRINNGCFDKSSSSPLAQDTLPASMSSPSEAGDSNGLATTPTKKMSGLEGLGSPSNPFRPILASTRVSRMLGVEPVAAEGALLQRAAEDMSAKLALETATPEVVAAAPEQQQQRPWWKELGDYLEDPHRHFRAMDALRRNVEWPEEVMVGKK